MGILVAGKPDVAFLCDEADQQQDHSSSAKAKWGKNDKEVFEGIEHPNAFHHLSRGMERRSCSQLQRIEKHPVEIPACQSQRNIKAKLGLVSVIPAVPSVRQTIFQFFQQL